MFKPPIARRPMLVTGLAAGSLLLVSLLGMTGCTSDERNNSVGAAVPRFESVRVVNTDVASGPNRLVLSLKDSEGKLLSDPSLKMRVRVFAAGSDKVASETTSDFIWIHEGDRGLYTANVDIPEAGQWEVEASPVGDSAVSSRALVKASARSSTPPVGSNAPRSQTKTAANAGGDLRSISTDDKPDPDLYRVSVADAVTSGKPTVIAFSTPARCSSNMCGPVIETLKAAKRSHPEANFVHVEIYDEPQNLTNDTMVQAVKEWGLPTEPWVFVVNPAGKVTYKFESIISGPEIDKALASG